MARGGFRTGSRAGRRGHELVSRLRRYVFTVAALPLVLVTVGCSQVGATRPDDDAAGGIGSGGTTSTTATTVSTDTTATPTSTAAPGDTSGRSPSTAPSAPTSTPPPAAKARYWVAPTGSDSNPGTRERPFRTLARGVRDLEPGERLFVRAGTYREALIDTIPSGTPEAPVTVAAFPGETVTLKPSGGGNVVRLMGDDTHHIVIDGLTLDGADLDSGDTVKITTTGNKGPAHHIRIAHSEIRNAPNQGILVAGDHHEFVDLSVHDNGSDDFDHGLYIGSPNNLIEGCDIFRNSGWGVHIYNGRERKANFNTVRFNRIHDNARVGDRGNGIILSSGRGNVAHDNVVWGNKGGIAVNYGASGTRVFSNTVFDNGPTGIPIGAGSAGAEVEDNIVFQHGRDIPDKGSKTRLRGNVVGVDPRFVDVQAENFRLRSNSPATGKGASPEVAQAS
jgi:parallel beta-helix repeat protein